MFYHHHQEVCLFSVFRYCQSREGIESLFLIERLWREEVCGEKENLSEMFLVFKQLLRRRGWWPTLLKAAWQDSFIYPTTPSTPIFFWNLQKKDFWNRKIVENIFQTANFLIEFQGFLKAEKMCKYLSDSSRLLKCIMCIFCLKCKFHQENSLCIESENYLQFLFKAVYPSSLPRLIKDRHLFGAAFQWLHPSIGTNSKILSTYIYSE